MLVFGYVPLTTNVYNNKNVNDVETTGLLSFV